MKYVINKKIKFCSKKYWKCMQKILKMYEKCVIIFNR
jgi:hypothetical protein